MSNRKTIVIQATFATLIIFGINCNRNETQDEKLEISNDIKWVRSSVEYQAICIQTYRWAWKTVKMATPTLSLKNG